ncbi:hypothetical protein [Singulisphaera acidiphila]|nr:hypothetical protein [Singulisphaera acidiphila]
MFSDGLRPTRWRNLRRLAAHYNRLAIKYDRAQWRPWLPVEPDPPLPK